MLLVDDKNGNTVQGFAPTGGKTYDGITTVIRATCIKIGSNVKITIDGKELQYYQGAGLILLPNMQYIFSGPTDCHIME